MEDRSVLAAGGWCAPSEVVYSRADEIPDRLLALPEILISREPINRSSLPPITPAVADEHKYNCNGENCCCWQCCICAPPEDEDE